MAGTFLRWVDGWCGWCGAIRLLQLEVLGYAVGTPVCVCCGGEGMERDAWCRHRPKE